MIHCNNTMAARRRERKKNKMKESSTNVVQERCAKWVKVFTSLMGIDHIYKQESNIRLALWLWQASTCAVAKAAKRKKAQAIGLAFVMNPICYTNNHWNIFTIARASAPLVAQSKWFWIEGSRSMLAPNMYYIISSIATRISIDVLITIKTKKNEAKRETICSLYLEGTSPTEKYIYIMYVCNVAQ